MEKLTDRIKNIAPVNNGNDDERGVELNKEQNQREYSNTFLQIAASGDNAAATSDSIEQARQEVEELTKGLSAWQPPPEEEDE